MKLELVQHLSLVEGPFTHQLCPFIHTIGFVDRQHSDRRAPDRRATHQDRPTPTEMTIPGLSPRVKQPNLLPRAGIDARQVWPFVFVACRTCQGQVSWNGLASMLLRDDMLDFKGQVGEQFGQVTVLAPASRASVNTMPQGLSRHSLTGAS